MEKTPLGIFILVKFLQRAKTLLEMKLTLRGIVILVNAVQL